VADAAATHETQTRFEVDYQTDPSKYKHWKLSFDGPVATLVMDVDEEGGLRPGYKLKLNSYDLGVDIELHDALQRIRFEHPETRTVVLTSAKSRIFCSGANIYMLGLSTHAWKVNFCKFTNETRNGIEDSSAHSGLKFLAACNGTTAGGGYELALACDEIILVDDRNSAVSLPELPLLGVLPGTGGLTRVTDKRKVRRDRADMFCTTPDGVRGQRAKDWGLVDDIARTQQFAEHVKNRAIELAKASDRPADAKGVTLAPLARTIDDAGRHYKFVDVQVDREARTATFTVRAPETAGPKTVDEALAAGANWWPLQMARELDDAILSSRTNDLELGLWILKTAGNPETVLAIDEFLAGNQNHWFVREVIGMLRRTFARLDVTSRSMFAVIEPGSCFAGTLMELALAADRSYMLDTEESEGRSLAFENEFRRAADGQRAFADCGAILWRGEGHRGGTGEDRDGDCATRRGGSRPCDGGTGRSRLGGRVAAGDRIARFAFARRADRARSEFAIRSAGIDGDADFRTAFGVAKLDFQPAERGRRERRPEGLRHRRSSEVQLGACVRRGDEGLRA
jgi:benzoyl-CoA-dihydrodiol lyase